VANEDKKVFLTGGVNRLVDPLRLRDDEAYSLKNLFPDLAQKLNKRKGCILYAGVDLNQTENDDHVHLTGTPVNALFPSLVDSGFVAVVSDGVNTWVTASCDPAAGKARNYKTVAWQDLRPCIVEFGAYVYVSLGRIDPGNSDEVAKGGIFRLQKNPLTEYMEFVDYYAGAPGTTPVPHPMTLKFIDGSGNAYAPKVMTTYRNRMVYAGFDAPYQDFIVFSDRFTPDIIEVAGGSQVNFSSTTRSIRVPGLKGERITGMKEVAVTSVANALESNLLIFSETGCVIQSGDVLQTTEVPVAPQTYFGDAQWKRVQYQCGCSSQESIVTTLTGLIWAGPDDVWVYDSGALPRPIGTKIRPVLAQTPPAYRWQWYAVYHRDTGTYRLAVHSAGQTLDWTAANRLLLGEQWWLDLRNGTPQTAGEASWFGPQVYIPAVQTRATPVPGIPFMTTKRQSVDAKEKIILAHYNGEPGLVFMEADGQQGYDSCGYGATAALYGIYGEQDNQIAFEAILKNYDFDEVGHDKMLHGLNGGFHTTELDALVAEFAVDGGRLIIQRQLIPEQLGLIGGVDPFGGGAAYKQYQGLAFEPSDAQRVEFRTLQVRLFDQPGWYVPYDGIGSCVIVKKPSGVDTVVQLTPGWYPDEGSYWAMLQTALGPVLGAAVTISRVGGPPAVYIEIACAVNWFPVFTSADATITDEQERSSRKVFASLGFNTAANPGAPAVQGVFDAQNIVREKLSAGVELVDLLLRVYHFRRKSSGGRYEPKVA
jgi:hypothetical protein